MSGTRFARSGRWRLFLVGLAVALLLTMLIIFHNQQEQLESIVQQKYVLERSGERDRLELEETRRISDHKMQELNILHEREKSEEHMRYEKLLKRYEELEKTLTHTTKQLAEQTAKADNQLQALRSDKQKEHNVDISEIKVWEQKYDTIIKEKDRMEVLLHAANSKANLALQQLEECQLHSRKVVPSFEIRQLNRPISGGATTTTPSGGSRNMKMENVTKVNSSFHRQELVSPGQYYIPIHATNTTTSNHNVTATNNIAIVVPPTTTNTNNDPNKKNDPPEAEQGVAPLPFSLRDHNSFIIHSVENFQILSEPLKKQLSVEEEQHQQQEQQKKVEKLVPPLPAPHKASSTMAVSLVGEKSQPNNASNTSSTSTAASPLRLPPNTLASRKSAVPPFVAPVPDQFDEMLKEEAAAAVVSTKQKKSIISDGVLMKPNIETKEMADRENNLGNNRYANAVRDLNAAGGKISLAAAVNEDSGAHEIKDPEAAVGDHFNMPAIDGGGGGGGVAVVDGNNFFDRIRPDDDGGVPVHQEGHDDVDNAAEQQEGPGVAGAVNDPVAPVAPAGAIIDEDNPEAEAADDEGELLGVGGPETGDIAVKDNRLQQQQQHHQHHHDQLLEENFNNEVAGDHGKEMPPAGGDGLHMDDGDDQDEDDDEYSILAARQQGAQAIRN